MTRKFDEDRNIKFSRGLNQMAFDDIVVDNNLTIIDRTYDDFFRQLDNLLIIHGEDSGRHVDVSGPFITDVNDSESE